MSTEERTRYTIRMTEDESKEFALLSAWLSQEKAIPKQRDNDTVNAAIKLVNDLVVRPAVNEGLTYTQIVNKLSKPNSDLQDTLNRVEDSIQALTLLELNNYVAQDVPAEVKIAAMTTTTTKSSKVAQAAAKLKEIYQNMQVKRINDNKVDRL